MRASRVVSLIAGCLLLLPGLATLLGGSALGLAYAFGRGDDGYFDTTIDRMATDTAAITADDITFSTDAGSPDWILDTLDADVRIRATAVGTSELFVGIAPTADVDTYLDDVAHETIDDIDDDLDPTYAYRAGSRMVGPPSDVDIWVSQATGPGTIDLEWEAQSGEWSAVLMNADGAPGVAATVNVGTKADVVLPLALILLGLGIVVSGGAVALIVAGARSPSPGEPSLHTAAPVASPPQPTVHPVAVTASLDPTLSRWKWLVKWILAIPHFIVLAFLWAAFVLLTLVAAVAIVFTGRYPRGIFDFNVGVLRWTWRVTFYAGSGGIGTDNYPPFSLRPEPGEAAALDVAHPERLSRGLVFVKWFLAIPHLVIVALLAGGSIRWLAFEGDRIGFDLTGGGGLLGVLVIVAGLVLLFTGRYPPALFDLIVGFNRWVFRTVAYVALMTDEYPPFRLDQGPDEPAAEPNPAPPDQPDLDLRVPAPNPATHPSAT